MFGIVMDRVPNDLVPLPTAPWDERPASIPLNVDECRTAIWRTRGNISRAAALIKVPAARFRRFVSHSPRLQAEVNEAREQLADIAEDIAYEALTDATDSGRRDSMARFVLGSVGKNRGFGSAGGSSLSIHNPKGPIQITWGDGSSIVGGDDGSDGSDSSVKVIEHE